MNQRYYLWWMVLPVLPFLLAIFVLNILSDGTITLLSSQLAGPETAASAPAPTGEAGASLVPQALTEAPSAKPAPDPLLHTTHQELRFTGGLLIYAAVAFFHSVICLRIIGYVALLISRLDRPAMLRSVAVLGVTIALVALVNLAARGDLLIGALNMTYRSTCAAIVVMDVAAHLAPGACDQPPLSELAKLAAIPYGLGIFAAAMTSALTATAYDGADGEADLLAGAELSDRAFQATAFVLASSVTALVAFYRLPLPLIQDPTLRALVADYGQGMAMFWGVGFTLTLLAIFAPSTLLVQRLLAEYRDPDAASALQAKLAQQSPRKRLQDILTFLAPLLVGSAATILEQLAGVLT
jgi:hypothetical protein